MAAIKKQVEFYFSDSNYRKDTFLKAAAETDPEGFIPIAVLLTFNRIKALSATVADIAGALVESEIVEISADGSKIRRATPLPALDTSKEQTLYVKGYPVDDTDVTIESIAEEFSKFGKVNMVRLRRKIGTKEFKGGCFIEFDTAEAVQAALAAANEPGSTEVKLKYKDTPFLCVMSLSDWLARKEDKKAVLAAKKSEQSSGDRKRKSDGAEDSAKKEIEFTAGLIIKVGNVPADVNHYQLKDFFATHGDVKFVESVADEAAAYVRVADSDSAAAIVASINAGLSYVADGPKFTGELLSGEEEKGYWTKIVENGNSNHQKRGGGRGGGRGGRGRGGGRGGRGRGGGDRKRQRRDD